MKRAMRKVLACVVVMMIALSVVSGALAAEYPSKAFKLPAVQSRPTDAVTEPVQDPTPVPEADPVEEPTEEPAEEPAAEPIEEATEEPAEEPDEEEAEPEEKHETITGSAVVVLKNEGSSLNVRAAADAGAACVASLKHGDVVSVYGTADGWTHIRTANGVEGYVSSAYLQDELPEEPAADETEEPAADETEEPAADETEEPAVDETEEPAADETEEPAVDETEEPAADETEEPAADETEEPAADETEEPAADETEEPAADETEEPAADETEEPAADETEEPAAEPTDEIAVDATKEPETVELKYIFERDENGALVLDENGDPVVTVPEGMEIPVTWLRDEAGNLILDENGDPIAKDTVPADAEVILTLEDKLDPNRYIDVYLASSEEGLHFGEEATLIAVMYGYDNAVYTLQWQSSPDGETWNDVPGATETRCTVVVTEENYLDYWQIEVTITDVLEGASEAA